MREWETNIKQNPPPPGVTVEVKGSAYFGEWTSEAMRVDYRPGSTKKQLKQGWRWMRDGLLCEGIEAWRFLE